MVLTGKFWEEGAPVSKVYIVGVGGDGVSSLGQGALDIINQAELICGGQRLLDMFPRSQARKVAVKSNVGELAELVREKMSSQRTVVLASGDPNFYGIARSLVGRLGKDNIEVLPNVSSMQLAFARIKESWDDAALVSVHGRAVEDVISLVRSSRKIAILTDDQHTPAEIARLMMSAGLEGYRAFVCENLGGTSERVTESDLAGLLEFRASPLNVLVLLRETGAGLLDTAPLTARYQVSPPFGIPDGEFFQRRPLKGLITKAEVRVVSLSKMRLCPDSLVWDVGAGSGSVSIEASLIARLGTVYAVERQSEGVALVRRNVGKFGTENVIVVEGAAPGALEWLPDPDAVFIGGTGGRMAGILDVVCRRLKPGGAIVANMATIANLNSAVEGLEARGYHPDVALVSISRSKKVAGLLRFEALDPVFVVSATRSEGTDDRT